MFCRRLGVSRRLGKRHVTRGRAGQRHLLEAMEAMGQNEISRGKKHPLLVGGLVAMNFIFPEILGIIIPIDVHIFQRGGPTTNQINIHEPAMTSGAYRVLGVLDLLPYLVVSKISWKHLETAKQLQPDGFFDEAGSCLCRTDAQEIHIALVVNRSR